MKNSFRMKMNKKPEAIRELEALAMDEARQKHPGMPFLAPRTYRDDSANELTKAITKYIDLKGGWATRVNNQGTFSRKLGRYIPSTSKRGLADIMATYKGRSLHIEIKAGRDSQSEYQRKVQSEVNQAGGLYFLAHNFTEFKQWFDNI